MATTFHLDEVTALGPITRVDAVRGVIYGVRILGLQSKNGREYTEAAARGAVPLYEGVKVNVNHSKGPGGRSYADRLGSIRNVQFAGRVGLRADFHFNPKHAIAEQLIWDAQHAPGNVGFS